MAKLDRIIPHLLFANRSCAQKKTKRQFGGLFEGLFLPAKYDIV